MTLQECIDKHGFGNGQRYRMTIWNKSGMWFEPKLLSPNKSMYIGFVDSGKGDWFIIDRYNWEYIVPEPKKIVRWLWVNRREGTLTKMLTEEEAKCDLHSGYIKLEWSRTEFIEE